MILKSLKLHNIRSYVSQDIEFPENSLMLWGDIGSGKSTILLAIEFALFGILRGTVEGASLLRHGTRQGFVELCFVIGKDEITIRRNLKRSEKNVQQDAGYILRNDTKYEGTATELKTRILDILGYPKDLLTKSKAMIFRYTVYTPQEEMKQILNERAEERLDTLRRVFGMERYKRIKENAVLYARSLKEKRKEGEGKIFDIKEKQESRKEREDEIKSLTKKISEVNARLEKSGTILKSEQEKAVEYESKVKELNSIKQNIEIEQLKLQNLISQNQKNNDEIKGLESQIESLKKEVPKEVPESLKQKIKGLEKEINTGEDALSRLREEIASLSTRKKSSGEIKTKITKLDRCPLCEQDVGVEHKHSIMHREDSKIESINNDIEKKNRKGKELSDRITILKKETDSLKAKDREADITKIKAVSLKEKMGMHKQLNESQKEIKASIGKANTSILSLREKLKLFEGLDKRFKEQKEKTAEAEKENRQIELAYVSLQKELEGVERILSIINKEIEEKLIIKKEVEKLKAMSQWVEDFLLKLVSTIEKHIMTNVYREFDELFQNWFRVLIEDESLNVRLNDEFTPVIEQDGYETTLDSLSGGEKNSCALAYRLALNKVVNDLLSGIKTKDLIILDEPTDGFSTEQIDRMRDVLEELNVKQIIIVSHENKMESFVENVLKIRKESHISQIA